MAHRIAPQAEIEIDDIWCYIAKQSGDFDIADRFIDSLADRFLLLARHSHVGAAAPRISGPVSEASLSVSTSSSTASNPKTS